MDPRNKWFVGVARILLALALLAIGGSGLFFILSGNMPEVPNKTPVIEAAEIAFTATGILLFAKIVEVICAIMLLSNFRPALAVLLFAPISVGIILYDLTLWRHVPSALIPAVLVFVLNSYLGFAYWEKYRMIFTK